VDPAGTAVGAPYVVVRPAEFLRRFLLGERKFAAASFL